MTRRGYQRPYIVEVWQSMMPSYESMYCSTNPSMFGRIYRNLLKWLYFCLSVRLSVCPYSIHTRTVSYVKPAVSAKISLAVSILTATRLHSQYIRVDLNFEPPFILSAIDLSFDIACNNLKFSPLLYDYSAVDQKRCNQSDYGGVNEAWKCCISGCTADFALSSA